MPLVPTVDVWKLKSAWIAKTLEVNLFSCSKISTEQGADDAIRNLPRVVPFDRTRRGLPTEAPSVNSNANHTRLWGTHGDLGSLVHPPRGDALAFIWCRHVLICQTPNSIINRTSKKVPISKVYGCGMVKWKLRERWGFHIEKFWENGVDFRPTHVWIFLAPIKFHLKSRARFFLGANWKLEWGLNSYMCKSKIDAVFPVFLDMKASSLP
jgi:hypothetical protein